MDIYDFCGLVSDDSVMVAIWDFTTEEEVFCGELRDAAHDEWGGYEILSIDFCVSDPRGVSVILNIETEEDED